MTTPSALIFDLDDTLIRAYANRGAAWRDHLAGYAAALHPHNPVRVADTVSSHAAHFWRSSEVYDRGGHDLEAARRTIVGSAFRELAIDAPALAAEIADAFTAKRKQGYALFEDTLPVLTNLKEKGIRLGLLTNGGSDSQRAKLERFALSDYFDYIGISEEIGHAKPDAAVFELALTALIPRQPIFGWWAITWNGMSRARKLSAWRRFGSILTRPHCQRVPRRIT